MSKAVAVICFLLLIAQGSLAQASPPMTPAEILSKVSSVYASCSSYADEGKISSAFSGKDGFAAQPFGESFTTAFVRPDAFRFEFAPLANQGRLRFIAWKAGELERAYLATQSVPIQEKETSESLLDMFNISHGAALTVPALLMPDIFHGKGLFASLTDLKLDGEEKLDHARVFKIEALLNDSPVIFWIDANQFLIVQVAQTVTLGKMDIQTMTRYRPVLNARIAANKLAFNVPGVIPSVEPAPATPELQIARAPRLRSFGKTVHLSTDEIEKLRIRRERLSEDEDVVRVDTDMVVSDVLVIDHEGRSIQGLGPQDFIIKEDDQPQDIGSLSLGSGDQVPRSIVLIIDYSNSQLPYVITSIEAAKKLVDQLKPRDHMALVTDDVKLLVDFTNDKDALKAQLDFLKRRAMSGSLGRSLQYDALMAALNELFTKEDERPIVIFQTDGDQLNALGREAPPLLRPYMPAKKFDFDALLIAAERARVTIYSIIPGVSMIGLSGQELLDRSKLDWDNRLKGQEELAHLLKLPWKQPKPPTQEALLANADRWIRYHLSLVGIAKATGGWPAYLAKPEQADDLYARVLNDINQRYVIAYYPKNRTRDGKRRKVSFEVRGHPEYIILGRRSYFAPLP